jgi:cytidine deaminase
MSKMATVEPTDLITAARSCRGRSHAPYSKFRAGAAVETDRGDVVLGVIVENVSLGLAMCAERVALFAAIADGARPVALALVAPSTGDDLTWPCGACLQVALELGGPELPVHVSRIADDAPVVSTTVAELLPNGPYVDRRPGHG